ncbi:unnamed protein product [Lupinus luteus]|uniref:Uncharacterized protein n=1 Tax=Lupinus luteus TaxID=3873 RepID=A0AAV1W831_LUPLU
MPLVDWLEQQVLGKVGEEEEWKRCDLVGNAVKCWWWRVVAGRQFKVGDHLGWHEPVPTNVFEYQNDSELLR